MLAPKVLCIAVYLNSWFNTFLGCPSRFNSITRRISDRSGMRLVIELKREGQPKKVLNQLFKYTAMQSTFGANMLALVEGSEPRVLTLKRMLQHYIEWRHLV